MEHNKNVKLKTIRIDDRTVVEVLPHVDEAYVRDRFRSRRSFSDFETLNQMQTDYGKGITNKRIGGDF